MSSLSPPSLFPQVTERISQDAPGRVSLRWSLCSTFIYILDNNLLLSIFYHCRPLPIEEDDTDDDHISECQKSVCERWWYRLVHVCRRWRYLVLASASSLGLYLVCTHATPVADMLAHSPLLPLIIDYVHQDLSREMAVEDEEGILLALHHRHRVSRIRLWIPSSNLRKLVAAMDGEFPKLEYLYIRPLTDDGNTLILPKTFQAPRLRQIALRNVTNCPGVSHPPPPTPRIQSAEEICRVASSSESQHWRIRGTHIHTLDDDSLLNIFYLYRPILLDKDEHKDDDRRILQGGEWNRERWWYKFTHVCRRWRYLMRGSASYLGLGLICTYGTPVADMLAHSPPLPLIIDYIDLHREITVEDEQGLMVALQHRDRVRRIRLWMPVPALRKLITIIDNEFPKLEYLYIRPAINDSVGLIPFKNIKAPNLCHLVLFNFTFPIGSPLLMTAVGLVTFSLQRIPRSAYFHSSYLLQRLSLMPQLEVIGIDFRSPGPSRGVVSPVMTHITLPNLRWFGFCGATAYLEALLSRMTTPFLEKFQIEFPDQPTFSVPHLPEFISTAKNLKFSSAASAKMGFSPWGVWVRVYSHAGAKMYSLDITVRCEHLDRQVASTAQIFSPLGAVFSSVEGLSLECRRHSLAESSEWNNEADRAQWRELFRSFSNVKTLRVDDGLVTQLSDSLRLDDGELSMDLFPELKELSYHAGGGDAFMAFIDARQKAGHPVTLHQL
ncbi:hypothetical protein BJV74DRAFT_66921 [Russula compacta]|nr:hypothetical protein BJV74DRAFT_66921 [Russula compacta]